MGEGNDGPPHRVSCRRARPCGRARGCGEAKSLIYCAEGSPAGFDPALHTDPATLDASSQAIYNRLVQFKPGTAEIVPALAESWDISPDGREYTFRLRPGVKFHTTADFTPARRVQCRRRRLQLRAPMARGSSLARLCGRRGLAVVRRHVAVHHPCGHPQGRRPDRHLRAPAPLCAVPRRSRDGLRLDPVQGICRPPPRPRATREKLDLAPVGTGPFRLVEYQPGAAVRYEANPDYWRERAPLDTLTFEITPDSGVRYEKLKSGDCQVIPSPNPADLAAIRADQGLRLLEGQGLALSLSRLQHHRAALRPGARPPRDRARDRQSGHRRGCLQGRCGRRPVASLPAAHARRRQRGRLGAL